MCSYLFLNSFGFCLGIPNIEILDPSPWLDLKYLSFFFDEKRLFWGGAPMMHLFITPSSVGVDLSVATVAVMMVTPRWNFQLGAKCTATFCDGHLCICNNT